MNYQGIKNWNKIVLIFSGQFGRTFSLFYKIETSPIFHGAHKWFTYSVALSLQFPERSARLSQKNVG